MARVGGRSSFLAWFVGLLMGAAVVALVWLALPMIAPSLGWLGTLGGGQAGATDPPATSAPVADCEALYPEALWSYLVETSGGNPVQDTSPPVTTATEFTAAINPQVRFTCSWSAEAGTVTTTVADVGPDAGAIALAALPAIGFTCDSPEGAQSGRVRCSRADDVSAEEIDLQGGVWVSSSMSGWQPERYASRVADIVLAAPAT